MMYKKTRQFFWQKTVFTLSIIWCFNMHIYIYIYTHHTLGNKNYTYLLTPQTNVMHLKHKISNGSSRRDMWPFLIILGLKLIKKKESSSVYYTYWQYVFWITCYNKSIIVSNTAKISGSLSPRHGTSSGCGWRNGLQYGG